MADSELAAVRAQIKSWEREFRSTHGRDPSVQDIKDHPHIAEKYKLYKRITKAASSSSSNVSSSRDPSSSCSRLSSSLSKPRSVTAVEPLPGFNPFSPVKNKNRGKQKPRDTLASSASQPSKELFSINPFATPVKSRPNLKHPRTPSPDPFPLITQALSQGPPANMAVSRARKRLRGEPVSPSPNKQKRQHLPVPEVNESSDSDNHPDLAPGVSDLNTYFIDDSPVKAPAGGKSFKLLFEDALPALSFPKNVSESAHPSHKLNTLGSYFARGCRDPFIQAHSKKGKPGDIKSATIASSSSRPLAGTSAVSSFQINVSKAVATPSNSMERAIQPKSGPAESNVPHMPAKTRSSVKRSLGERDLPDDSTHQGDTPPSSGSLVLPSPPPGTVSPTVPRKLKGGMQKTHKKLRVKLGSSENEEDSSDGIAVKVVARARCTTSHRDLDNLDWDPLLDFHAHNRDSGVKAEHDADLHESGTFTVDLPDNLRRVLAISPPGTQNSKEEHVVRCLLYGDRVGHYDASKGGNIWNVGEGNDGMRVDTETEDDWEGEPVPWEAGEL
ncbi:hypothetical protein V8B97DRAFT_2008303 [Scleroderma yunnanense]